MGMDDPGKMEHETRPLKAIKDGFAKILLLDYDVPEHVTEDGIRVMSVIDYLLDEGTLRFN